MVRREPVPALPKSSGASGCEQRAVAGAADDPFVAVLLDLRAHRLHRRAGAHHVLAFEQAGDAGLAGGQAAEHEGAVRDRLVARHARRARERLASRAAAGCGTAACDMIFPGRNARAAGGSRVVAAVSYHGSPAAVIPLRKARRAPAAQQFGAGF